MPSLSVVLDLAVSLESEPLGNGSVLPGGLGKLLLDAESLLGRLREEQGENQELVSSCLIGFGLCGEEHGASGPSGWWNIEYRRYHFVVVSGLRGRYRKRKSRAFRSSFVENRKCL